MPISINISDDHPYFALAQVFEAAFNQASSGKGKERHAYSEEEPYCDQVLCEIDRRLHGFADGPRYQAVKKIYESARMDPARAIRELLGAINYTAAAVIILKDRLQIAPKQPAEDTQKHQIYTKFLGTQNDTKNFNEKKNGGEEAFNVDEIFDDNFGNADQMKGGGLGLS